jgi:C-methyltransferase
MQIAQLAGASWVSKALSAAARLGLADQLRDRPMTHVELARRTDCDPEVLLRLMEGLAALGIFEQDAAGMMRNTPDSEQLRSDHPRSMRYFCMLAGEMYYDAWGALMHTLRTGKPASRHVFGGSIYEHMEANPEAARVYDRAMEDLARPVAAELVDRGQFAGVRTVVDVGGGRGALLAAVLAAYPDLHGVCADRADVCARAERERLEDDPELARRLSFRPTDFFTEVPTGGDRYLLKNVLHNWSFDSGTRILLNVARAMRATPGSRLLVLEPLVEDEHDAMHVLFQMVICEDGTRGLSAEEMRNLLDTAGLTVLTTDRLSTGHTLLECTP